MITFAEILIFVDYVKDYYDTTSELFPNKLGNRVTTDDILNAMAELQEAEPMHEWDGDSLDREKVAHQLIKMGVYEYPDV